MMLSGSVPILSAAKAQELEEKLFGGDEAKEWQAMQRAGSAVAAAILRDSLEIGGLAVRSRILVLVGKGHNGGDALIAAETLLAASPQSTAEILFVFGPRLLRPLAHRAWLSLTHRFGPRITVIASAELAASYELCLDGIFGFQFRPPVDPTVLSLSRRINALPVRFRAAVDLPSGAVFRADFTYATGSVKSTVLDSGVAGRVRYLDLGFFSTEAEGSQRVLTADVLKPLTELRSPGADKRSHGHLFILAGSTNYPGAVMMAVLAALRSGVGLVTAFIPESLVPAYAARVPEAIWVGWPQTPAGGLALEGLSLLRERIERADALVIGPGIGREAETLALAAEIVKSCPVPVLLDADALQTDIVRAAKPPLILTPHAGEFSRIAGSITLQEFAATSDAVVILKGPITRVVRGQKDGQSGGPERSPIYHSCYGGPVLARGGSGDLLAGLVGGLLAQTPQDPLFAAAQGTVWHGLAADCLARRFGQVAVNTTMLVDCLAEALRETTIATAGAD